LLAVFNAMIDRLPPPPLPGRISLNLPAIVAGDTTLAADSRSMPGPMATPG
jgi:hypothetical protein